MRKDIQVNLFLVGFLIWLIMIGAIAASLVNAYRIDFYKAFFTVVIISLLAILTTYLIYKKQKSKK